jgi:hypothetical protein
MTNHAVELDSLPAIYCMRRLCLPTVTLNLFRRLDAKRRARGCDYAAIKSRLMMFVVEHPKTN